MSFLLVIFTATIRVKSRYDITIKRAGFKFEVYIIVNSHSLFTIISCFHSLLDSLNVSENVVRVISVFLESKKLNENISFDASLVM